MQQSEVKMASPMALFSVQGKNVLITGSSRGIGQMLAQGFVKAGANVFITSRDGKACATAAETLIETCGREKGSGAIYHGPSNVSSRDGCKVLASEIKEIFGGRLDVLINNAGTSWGEDIERESGKMNWGWDKVLDLNCKGMFYLTRECVPMLEREKGADPGRIINVGSVAGLVPQEAPTHAYDCSKSLVHHLTRKMSADLAPKNITVNCLAPGFVPSRMSDGLKTWGADKEEFASQIPLGRMGNQDDMAGACIYLSSKAGQWVTGTTLTVDGGTVGAMRIPLSSL